MGLPVYVKAINLTVNVLLLCTGLRDMCVASLHTRARLNPQACSLKLVWICAT